jgi:phospholipid/cholesterol/gamma-HCH transport system permease protein
MPEPERRLVSSLPPPPIEEARAKAGVTVRPEEVNGTVRIEGQRIVLDGSFGIHGGGPLYQWLARAAKMRRKRGRAAETPRLDIDIGGVTSIDGAAMAVLVEARATLQHRGYACEIINAEGNTAELMHLYGGDGAVAPLARPKPEGTLDHIGRATLEVVHATRDVLGFGGDMVLAALGILREPKTANAKEVPRLIEAHGADAVPIVVLINFLVGFVMAFQGAVQLKQFGANLFVADLVGLSTTRELGPLMTAIIVAGRSGASIAAELGTMKVSEELDALRTLGFGPVRYLVLPRAAALLVALPILTLLADLVAILGGAVVGAVTLDLPLSAYLIETQKAVSLWSVGQGLVKSEVFALAIALIACQQGFATSGGAEGVGKRTTSSVVTILFTLILVDAAFTVFFHYFNL